jgi:hypothetical protein
LQNLVKMATDFTWAELPARDPVDGSRTVAGWIARSQVLAWRAANIVFASHVLYLTLRVVTRSPNPFFFNAWFPFDADNTVGYTAVLVLQVATRPLAQFGSSLGHVLILKKWTQACQITVRHAVA